MEQTATALNEGASLVKPTVITDVTLLSPGIWKGVDNQKTRYTAENILAGFENTNWQEMNLFLDHKDNEGPAAAYWIGFIRNPRMSGGELKGDLEIWHPLFSMFIKQAKAKFGVSMTMNGHENFNTLGDFSDYNINSFQSGSLVDEPGCETSWLPKMLSKGDKNSKIVTGGNVSLENIKSLAAVTNMEEVRKQKGMSVSEFYAVPRDPPSSSSLPIYDAAHVRNALARFNQTHFDNPSQKKTAWNKIVKAANKFGIKVSEKKELSSTNNPSKKSLASNDAEISESSDSEEYSDEEDNCKEVIKMTDENQTQENAEEQKEKEESKEESNSDSSTDESEKESVKSLSAKVDKLSDSVDKQLDSINALTNLVQKSLAAGDESKETEDSEESKDEESKGEEESAESEDKSDVEKELEETKKELAATKLELDSPDRKTLASGAQPGIGVDDSNAGMISFLGKNANLI